MHAHHVLFAAIAAAASLTRPVLSQDQGSGQAPSQAPAPCAPPKLVLHFKDPFFEARAQEAIAEVWALAGSCMDLSAAKPGKVHIYNDVVACQEIAQKHGQTHTQAEPGFVLADKNQGHVLFWRCGWCRDARWRIGNITAQLALSQASPLEPDAWPTWFEGGLGTWAEGPIRSDAGWVEPRSHMSSRSHSLFHVRQMRGRMPTIADVITESAPGFREGDVAALQRLVFAFLFERHPDATRAAFLQATAATSRTSANEAMLEGLRSGLGDASWRDLDAGLSAYLDAQPQTQDLEISPPMDRVGQPGDAAFVPNSPAIMWLDHNRKSSFVVTAQPQLVQVGQGDLAFERTKGRWVRVTLLAEPNQGWVFVSEREMKDDRPSGWTVHARSQADVPSIRVGGSVDLQVEVKARKLTVIVAGQVVVQHTLEGATLAGRFGVGGPFGNQVAWRGVRVR